MDGDDGARELVAETARDLHAAGHPGDGSDDAVAALLDPLVRELNALELLLDRGTAGDGLLELRGIADSIEGLLVSRHPPCLTTEAGEALGRGAARLRRLERLLASPDRDAPAAAGAGSAEGR